MADAADEVINKMQNINELLREKNKIINRIGAILNFKAHTKTKMSKTQIIQFMRFNRMCAENTNQLADILSELEYTVKTEIASGGFIHRKNKISEIHEHFDDISARQRIVTGSLKELVAAGRHTVLVLCGS